MPRCANGWATKRTPGGATNAIGSAGRCRLGRLARGGRSRRSAPAACRLAPHLTADGTERAREMLAEFGVSVDFLR